MTTDNQPAPERETKLHDAVMLAVSILNSCVLTPDEARAHDTLRQALVDYADAQTVSARTALIREQQRTGGGEVTAVMVSPVPATTVDAPADSASSKCVKCGDIRKWSDNAAGICERPIGPLLNTHMEDICACQCEFASSVSEDEREKSKESN